MGPVSPSELAKIPFITRLPQDGRALLLSSIFDTDTGEWYAFIEGRSGELRRLAGGQVVQGTYLSRGPADPTRDLEFFLGTWVTQHLSWFPIVGRFLAIKTTVQHLTACLEKYLRFTTPPPDRNENALLIEAELGHLVVLVRRFYDLLQKLAKDAGAIVKDARDFSRKLFEDLPDSFADVCLHGDQPRGADEIKDKWRLTPELAEFYANEARQFALVRSIRVAIEHHGKSPGLILCLPEGMAISLDEAPWRNLPIWNDKTVRGNQRGSVRALFAFLVGDLLDLPSRFVRSYWSTIAVPPAIAEGLVCYLRGPFTHHLVSLPQVLEQPWERG
jgi:hypothetical protein